jgi:hypothetical protein
MWTLSQKKHHGRPWMTDMSPCLNAVYNIPPTFRVPTEAASYLQLPGFKLDNGRSLLIPAFECL